jgi:iron complex transport system ATP-binding protein
MKFLQLSRLGLKRNETYIFQGLEGSYNLGEIVLLTGANGAGKSSLLSAISGDLAIASGEIFINDRALSTFKFKELALLRSSLSQSNSYSLAFSPRQILERIAKQFPGATRSLKSLSAELNLEALLDKSLLELSGGERQRVSLAFTLMPEVPLYLLDEPLSAQDDENSKLVSRFIAKIVTTGALAVIATHTSKSFEETSVSSSILSLD